MVIKNMRKKYYIHSPREAVVKAGLGSSYALNNYYNGGLIADLKTNRFEKALRLGVDHFGDKVIDMGCADGMLLPSLSKHFEEVVAIDYSDEFVTSSKRLTKSLKLNNIIFLQ
jgi:2-polyprenyl-3-methyl-5-hydroxy-6-metoxy-1,4-benzoquinol methylase